VIVPTFNRANLLPVTLDSLLAQDYPHDRYEIIVANNASTDGTERLLQEYTARDSRVRFFTEPRQGVHYARNSAGKMAKGDILYFTDDDMKADKDLLKELVKVFEVDPKIASATGKVVGQFDVPPPEWVTRYLTNHLLSLTDPRTPEELIVSSDDLVFSCHQAITRTAFFESGGFNPENTAGVWIGDGETGLGIKLKQAGYKFAYTPKSITCHLIPRSRTTLSYLIRRVGNQGNCDSYTDYRLHRTRKGLLRDLLSRNSLGILRLMKSTISNILHGQESWHFLPARLAYVHRRNVYDLRLLWDPEFRKIVEIDDWLN
jgi:glycosyltransferase involved in cell wall biosynthesis